MYEQLGRGEKGGFAAYANFLGVNIPNMADFRLPR